MSTNEEIVNSAIEPITFHIASHSVAGCHLVFALAKHLIEKGIINLDDYMESHNATEAALKLEALKIESDNVSTDNEIHIGHIEKVFEIHRNELLKL